MRSFAVVAAMLLALPAHATLDISHKPTRNMDCSTPGECIATDADAVMNTDQLAALLADGDMRVVTNGVIFQDMVIASPFSWAGSHALTLESNDALFVRNAVTVQGTANLTLAVAGGPIFQNKGALRFWDTASRLTIDGQKYRLVGSIAELAAAVAARPRAFLALARDYDAAQDGQYTRDPVLTTFAGTFDGLGNRIRNLSIWNMQDNNVGLFQATKGRAAIRNLGLVDVNVLAENSFVNFAGALVGYNGGTIENCSVDGGTVRTDFRGTLGGLAGLNYGRIYRAWTNVSVEGAQNAEVGGLIGNTHGHVENVYALGRVIAGDQSDVGGLVGYSFGHVRLAYATGHVSGGQNARVGGLMGTSQLPLHHTYWDVETSGTSFGVGGANVDGATGMTTAELQAGLPRGFDPFVWTQDAAINGGLPYLLGNPPR